MSTEVLNIDVFLSHNWSVGRFRKFLALAKYNNSRAATCVAVLVMMLCFSFQAVGLLPLVLTTSNTKKTVHEDTPDKVGIFVLLLLACPVFVLVLLTKHEITCSACPRHRQFVFLDKICIHQTNDELKLQGIAKLGAFVASSSRLLILYSDLYLQKLWTVYEVACFLSGNSTQAIEVVHVNLPLVFISMMSASYFSHLALEWVRIVDVRIIFLFSYGSFASAWSISCRLGHKALARTWKRLANFKVEQALCASEADRPYVKSNIAAMMKVRLYVVPEATQKEALDAFDELVRVHVYTSMKTALGTSPLDRSEYLLMFGLTLFAQQLDYISALVRRNGIFNSDVWKIGLLYFTLCFGICPVTMELLVWLNARFLELPFWKECVWVTLGGIGCLLIVLVNGTVINTYILYVRSRTSIAFSVLFVVFNASWLMVSLFISLWHLWLQKKAALADCQLRENSRSECFHRSTIRHSEAS